MSRPREWFLDIPLRHRWLLAGAMALGAAVVVAYVLATKPNGLAGDQAEYDLQGRFFDMGKLWWSTTPLDFPHATAWKAPAYPAWVGFWYEVVGANPTRVVTVQGLVAAPLTVLLTWLLGRRLFGLTVAAVSAFVVALFPLSWEFFGLLYSEALAIPLTLLILLLAIDRQPSTARSIGVGALIGACILVRPTSFFLFAGLAAAWIIAVGWRRGAALTALSIACAVLVVAPWTIRNAIVLDGFVPVSIQDAAAYGTFNDEAANDPNYPYAWRAAPAGVVEGLERKAPETEVEFRSHLQQVARDYISEHPSSVPQAFFWNGLSRFWDVRRPARAVDEVEFDGRSRAVTTAGLAMYYVLFPLALLGLSRVRHRREILFPILALAAAASLVFTVQAGTRYRAPLEPLIVILACSTVTVLGGRRDGSPEPNAAGESQRPTG